MKKTEGSGPALPDARGMRVGVIVADFYEELADALEAGAREALDACGVAAEERAFFRVRGCFELPLAAAKLVDSKRFDALAALGVVVRGETPHFDFVAGECARGIMDVSLRSRVPIGFGVLTTETLEQAWERADPLRGNKGFDAVVAALAVLTIAANGSQ